MQTKFRVSIQESQNPWTSPKMTSLFKTIVSYYLKDDYVNRTDWTDCVLRGAENKRNTGVLGIIPKLELGLVVSTDLACFPTNTLVNKIDAKIFIM